MTEAESQRIDRWLWHARFARTRGAAQKIAVSGCIRVNRNKINSASRLVRPGDVLTMVVGDRLRVVRIRAIAERRGGAVDARLLYDDLQLSGAASPDESLPSG